ncbi:MAG: 3-oxoacyl-ACP synthase III family protein [Salinivirgaceae bacterium]
MLPVKIKGTGLYAPGSPISNQELMQLTGITFDDEKFKNKIGITHRHIAHLQNIKESTADFATKAAQAAMEDAGISADELGLVMVGTDTPEFISPATAIVVQGRLQGTEKWCAAFDVNASCASFAIAYDNAVRILASNPAIKYAVVIGVYNMPAFIRKDDNFSYPIFADGAGAVVIERDETNQSAYIGGQQLADGTQWDFIGIYAGGAHQPVTKNVLDANQQGLLSLKPLPGDRNVRLWPMVVKQLLNNHQIDVNEVDHFIFTQINKSVIVKVMEELNQPLSKTTFVMDKYGYTGSGCVPMAFHHAIKDGKIKRGDKVVFMASGAGLAVGSNLFIY